MTGDAARTIVALELTARASLISVSMSPEAAASTLFTTMISAIRSTASPGWYPVAWCGLNPSTSTM
jgi:hypothetical protein